LAAEGEYRAVCVALNWSLYNQVICGVVDDDDITGLPEFVVVQCVGEVDLSYVLVKGYSCCPGSDCDDTCVAVAVNRYSFLVSGIFNLHREQL